MEKKTIYIIGAGASFEAGLPVGNGLKKDIASFLRMKFEHGSFSNGNHDLYQALLRYANDKSKLKAYLQACNHIRANMPLAISIDNFIDSARDNEKLALCGKIAIVDSILKAERNSKLYFDTNGLRQTINFSALEDTWYLSFFRALTENCRVDDLSKRFSTITLLIFNYDRCVEHFIHQALMSYYSLSEVDAAEVIRHLTIVHPYGTVGDLRWQNQDSHTLMMYGGAVSFNHIISYAERIRTFTEGAHSDSMNKFRMNMKCASRLVFLGFAFHRLNMQLLSLAEVERYENLSVVDCYGTAFEASKSDQESIVSSINHLYGGELNIRLENMTCFQLFKNYSRSLGYS